jgi:hypothetical protein
MGNLLSNALKFTPAGGKILLAFDLIGPHISVADTGQGIPEDKIEKIFERYYQIAQEKGMYNWGTGIGLYYARRLAELHHASIRAANAPEGGSIFTFLLSADESAYSPREKGGDAEIDPSAYTFPLQTEAQYRGQLRPPAGARHPKILVLDDDSEISHYLQTIKSSSLSMRTAPSGVSKKKRPILS